MNTNPNTNLLVAPALYKGPCGWCWVLVSDLEQATRRSVRDLAEAFEALCWDEGELAMWDGSDPEEGYSLVPVEEVADAHAGGQLYVVAGWAGDVRKAIEKGVERAERDGDGVAWIRPDGSEAESPYGPYWHEYLVIELPVCGQGYEVVWVGGATSEDDAMQMARETVGEPEDRDRWVAGVRGGDWIHDYSS